MWIRGLSDMNRTSMIAIPLFAVAGTFCGLRFEPATLIWIVPIIGVAGVAFGLVSAWETSKRNT